jgi:uncharacterized protein
VRVIITGGTGVIGKRLAMLLSPDHEVIILSRNPQSVTDMPAGVQVQGWDARTANGWGHLLNGDTAIVNLAGKNPANWRWTAAHKRAVLESRIQAGKAVVEAVRNASQKPCVLLQASAVGYYGNRGDEILTEDSTPGQGFRAEVCLEWERVTASLDIRQCWLRIGIVLTKSGGAFPPMLLGSQMLGRQLGDGRQWIPWIHNEDTARAIQFLMMQENASGIFNLCAPEPVTNRVFMQTLGQVIHRPPIVPVPEFALRLALGEMAGTVLDSQRVLPKRLLEAGFNFGFSTIKEAVVDLTL